jgi:hypothetical protein
VSEFQRESQPSEGHATRATARLPGLNIEVMHRQSPAGDAEEISIHLQAVPSFEAFGRFLGEANPFAFLGRSDQVGLAALARSRACRDAALWRYGGAAEARCGCAAPAGAPRGLARGSYP